ncbi:hypothetical protein Tco_0525075, partial [Tanacetum coccineum]
FLTGLDDSYMQVRSSILSGEALHDVRSAYATIFSVKSHIVVASNSNFGTSQKSQTSAFVSNAHNRGNFQRNQTSGNVLRPSVTFWPNNANNNNTQGGGSGLICENCKFVSNNNYVGFRSSTGFTDKQLSALISLIKDNTLKGKNVQTNMAEYFVTLVSVPKLAKDNKIFVAFDEIRCYLLNQDLIIKNVQGIGNKCGGLVTLHI